MQILMALVMLVFAATRVQAETIYVSNELDNTVAVIDGGTLALKAVWPVGRRPRGLALGNGKLYVAVGDDNRIEIVDLQTGRVEGALPSGEDPEYFALHPDGRRLYVANENDGLVTVVDIEAKKILAEIEVGVEPEGMAASPDGKLVACTSETTSMLHVIDVERNETIHNLLIDTRPRAVRFSADSRHIWVTSELRGTVEIFETARLKSVGRIAFAIPGVPRESVQAVGLQLTRDGSRAFVALGPANRVAEIDARSLKVLRYHLTGQRVWHLALSPDEQRLYTANGNSGDVTVIDIARGAPLKSIPVGRSPWGIVVGP